VEASKKKKESPSDLTGVKSLGFLQVLEIFVVCENQKWMFGSF